MARTELVIFDCDGVLVDSEPIATALLAEELTALGLATTFDECLADFLGISDARALALIERRLGRSVPDGWEQRLEARTAEAFRERLEPVSGIRDALERITAQTCIASSGSHAKMALTLRLTGLHERFAGRIFSREDVARGKPAPDLFLHAAAQMGADPPSCVVVEDSPAGVQAARAAGMRVVAYAGLTSREKLEGPDTVVIDDMCDLPALVSD